MATSSTRGWRPAWAVAPGEVLLETLEERQMTQAQLAQRLGRPVKTINEIVKGKAAITPETALQLERTLGISARFWSGLEAQYREALARNDAAEQLGAQAAWADRFPIADLVRHGLIERGPTRAATLETLLSWLGLGNPTAFDKVTAAASYRASEAFAASPEAVTAWLRWGELQAAAVEAEPFALDAFRRVLRDVPPLTRKEPFAQIFRRVAEACATSGVVVVLTPELSGTHLSGAVRHLGSRVLIQLSLRHKTDDEFWFTFFHEAGHVVTGRRGRDVVDGPDLAEALNDADEVAADRFARDAMIQSDAYTAFVAAGSFALQAVRAFARDHSVAPGIVAGLLERDGYVKRGPLRSLKKPLSFPKPP